MLTYRLQDLEDAAHRRALFDDLVQDQALLTAADLPAFLARLDALLSDAFLYQDRMEALRNDLQDDLTRLQDAIDDASTDTLDALQTRVTALITSMERSLDHDDTE